jgi:hypothetical protein
MEDLLRWGSDWLEEVRSQNLACTVTYQRGDQCAEMPATVGKTIFRLDAGYGVTERYESRDYLVLTRDLVLNGAPILPQSGDRIRETDGSKVFVYEVMAPGGEPHYRYSDGYRKTLRIHTKLIATEDLP